MLQGITAAAILFDTLFEQPLSFFQNRGMMVVSRITTPTTTIEPIRWLVAFLLLLLLLPIRSEPKSTTTSNTNTTPDRQCWKSPSDGTSFLHLIVLVHGYLGSYREQEYLGEAIMTKSQELVEDTNNNNSHNDGSCVGNRRHKFVILNAKANTKISTDGIINGGQRLAAEISEWVAQQINNNHNQANKEVVTFSMVGNSLGGLYGRYALAKLDFLQPPNNQHTHSKILPLVFCTTSSPHIGVSQETFVKLSRWMEPIVATAFRQQTMNDLFMVNNSTVVQDMCLNNNNPHPHHADTATTTKTTNFLYPLSRFQKRIAVANAYKTDFLVSVSSGAFLSPDSDSIHLHQDADEDPSSSSSSSSSTRLMKDDTGCVVLQVVTNPTTSDTVEASSSSSSSLSSRDDEKDDDEESESIMLKQCVDSLDELGWHKIFIDTRKMLPGFMNLPTPELECRVSYTSKELKEHFETFGTLFPVAHPLNVANSRTDLYRKITKKGQPIVDALAELLVLDMVEYAEKEVA